MLSNNLAVLVGTGVCCVVPLLSFAAGVVYARYGLPFAVRFGWQRSLLASDDELD